MFKCTRCQEEFRDGAQCSVCSGQFDFACAGVTENGYRRLGDRKSTWRCTSCKSSRTGSPLPPPASYSTEKSPVPADMEAVLAELKRLSLAVAVLPGLNESVKSIKAELTELKSIKPEIAEIKKSIDFVDCRIGALSDKILEMEKDIQSLQKTKNDVEYLKLRLENMESHLKENEQRSRLNNIEIKGVPVSSSENLFDIFSKIGSQIKCSVPKEQINYIARIPMRNDKVNKTIVVSVHSRYLKDDFVAMAKKCTITPADLGLKGGNRIYVNDHLTLENKILLNKTKTLAKERGFAFTWVKACKICIRKTPTSPVVVIRTEADLQKL